MKYNRQFVIPFKGLKSGKHDFLFDIDEKFLNSYEENEINKGKVHIEIHMIKNLTMFELNFNLEGSVTVMCDRCLDDLEIPVSYTANLYIKFGDTTEEQSDEILILSHNEFELDVSQYIYEYLKLSLPYKRIHPFNKTGVSACNNEMIKKLEEYLIEPDIKNIDPRWDDLKSLLNNN